MGYQQQDIHVKDQEKWKLKEQTLNDKLRDKRQEVEDNISYYSSREAEYETKIEDLLTRMQEQNALYMKLQAEFDSYEWWEEGDAGHEHSKHRSRESLGTRSRPPSRPPTREDIHRPNMHNINQSHNVEEEDEDQDQYEDTEDESKSNAVFEPPSATKEHGAMPKTVDTHLDPEIPPRRGEKSSTSDDVSRSSSSWQEESSTLKRNSTSSSKST